MENKSLTDEFKNDTIKFDPNIQPDNIINSGNNSLRSTIYKRTFADVNDDFEEVEITQTINEENKVINTEVKLSPRNTQIT